MAPGSGGEDPFPLEGIHAHVRVTTDLHADGVTVSQNTVAKITAEMGIEGISPRTFKVKTTTVDPRLRSRLTWSDKSLIRAAWTRCRPPISFI